MTPMEIVKVSNGNEKIMDTLFKLQGGLNAAFGKFINQVKAPAKNGHVGYGYGRKRVQYDYVTLDDLISAINKGINGTGLSWSQKAITRQLVVTKTDRNKYGKIAGNHKEEVEQISIYTIISYTNGFSNTYGPVQMTSDSMDPQDVGSAITYAKRYSLATAFGINSDEDDDDRHDKHQQLGSVQNAGNNHSSYRKSNHHNSYYGHYQPRNRQQATGSSNASNSSQQQKQAMLKKSATNSQISYVRRLCDEVDLPKMNKEQQSAYAWANQKSDWSGVNELYVSVAINRLKSAPKKIKSDKPKQKSSASAVDATKKKAVGNF